VILFIGQAPGRRAPRCLRAFGGPGAGSRLAKLCGLSIEEFLARHETVNVFKTWRGSRGKGDAFNRRTARIKANRIKRTSQYINAQRIIFVGAEVARAFLSSMPEPCTRFGAFGSLGYVPHTSGVNHWYNSAVNRKKAQAFLRDMTEVA
jgi:uracil-DNA glycosylase